MTWWCSLPTYPNENFFSQYFRHNSSLITSLARLASTNNHYSSVKSCDISRLTIRYAYFLQDFAGFTLLVLFWCHLVMVTFAFLLPASIWLLHPLIANVCSKWVFFSQIPCYTLVNVLCDPFERIESFNCVLFFYFFIIFFALFSLFWVYYWEWLSKQIFDSE